MNRIIIIVLVIISVFAFPQMIESETSDTQTTNTIQNYLPVNQAWPTQDEIKTYITQEAITHGIKPMVALRIARCESGFNRTVKNQNSTATGIYQFLTSTWNKNCTGNRLNPYSNVDCFMDNYLKHTTWWVCK
jgi:hypothetical protein